jgi:hypothetical protein
MRQLRKGHTEPLIPAGESAQFSIGVVTGNTRLKGRVRQILHQLRENGATLVHSSFVDESVQIVFARGLSQATEFRRVAATTPLLNRTPMVPNGIDLTTDFTGEHEN